MSFLSIAFLTALPLALAPLLLHLFDRQRNVVIEWGAMQFLQDAVTRRTSARKLKQWLLLLMRVLAVMALVLALSRPLMKGSWFQSDERGETIVILDNSLSTLRQAAEQTIFTQELERARELIAGLPVGDSVRILLTSPYPVWATQNSLQIDDVTRSHIDDQLQELKATHGTSDLISALFTAVQAELPANIQQRNIVLLTDGQAQDWAFEEERSWNRFEQVLTDVAIPTKLEIVTLSTPKDAEANLAVASLRANRTTVGVDQPFQLTAQVKNFGGGDSTSTSLEWLIGQDELHSSLVPDLASGAVQDVVWKHSLSQPGVYSVRCQIHADDSLVPDNSATLIIEVVDQLPVLLVEAAADRTELQRDSYFVEAALGWIDGERTIERAVYAPSVIPPDRLASVDLSKHRAVVIPNLTSVDDEAIDRLQEFVRQGGGLWIGLGARTDVDAFHEKFFADGNGLAPLALDRIIDESSTSEDVEPVRMNPFASLHPATRQLADSDSLDLAEVRVSRRFRFVSPPAGEEASVLLSLTNGDPIAVERVLGQGRVIVQAIPLRLQWSDLARSQAFVVMVHDWLDYLSQPLATRFNLDPGEPIMIRLANTELKNASLKTPQGDEVELSADESGEELLFRSNRTTLPGDYFLETGIAGEAIPFHVNRDPAESDLTLITNEQAQKFTDWSVIEQQVAQANSGFASQQEPLWPYLLGGLIVLIAGELLLSGIISRERFGSDPIQETTQPWSEATNWGMTPLVINSEERVNTDAVSTWN